MKTTLLIGMMFTLSLASFKGLDYVGFEVNPFQKEQINYQHTASEAKASIQGAAFTNSFFKFNTSISILKKILVPIIFLVLLICFLIGMDFLKSTKINKMRQFSIFLCFLFISFNAVAQDKIPVKTVDDLPKHFYELSEPQAMSYIKNDDLAKELAAQIEKNLLSDLKKYDIQDKDALRDIYSDLSLVAMTNNDYQMAINYLEKRIAVTEKSSKKYMSDLIELTYLNAKIQTDIKDEAGFQAFLKSYLSAELEKMPFDVVQEEVSDAAGTMSFLSENLYWGLVSGQLQPAIDKSKNRLTHSLATQILFVKEGMKYITPYSKTIYAPVLQAYYDKNHTEVTLTDIWEDRNVIFKNKKGLSPVVICAWDSGVDTDVFTKENVWKNAKEQLDGKDNDGNGFIDDVHGIAFDLEDKPTIGVLRDVEKITPNINQYADFSKGLGDLQASVKSKEADAIKKHLAALKPSEVIPFIEMLDLYGGYSHGTHVAGIMLKDHPTAQMLTVRVTFDHKNISAPPTLESVTQAAKLYKSTIAYFKANHVKVVNMSWSYSLKGFEKGLAENGVGNSDEERLALAKKLFNIQKDALFEAMKSAPEILFVTSAGNSNDDLEFSRKIPSSFNLPNLLRVGAVDLEGKVTGFTTMGNAVDVYANGYEVESYVPGGEIRKYSGTSMSSPQVANCAAKLWAKYPTLTVQEVIEFIKKSGTVSTENEKVLLLHPQNALKLADEKKAK